MLNTDKKFNVIHFLASPSQNFIASDILLGKILNGLIYSTIKEVFPSTQIFSFSSCSKTNKLPLVLTVHLDCY